MVRARMQRAHPARLVDGAKLRGLGRGRALPGVRRRCCRGRSAVGRCRCVSASPDAAADELAAGSKTCSARPDSLRVGKCLPCPRYPRQIPGSERLKVRSEPNGNQYPAFSRRHRLDPRDCPRPRPGWRESRSHDLTAASCGLLPLSAGLARVELRPTTKRTGGVNGA